MGNISAMPDIGVSPLAHAQRSFPVGSPIDFEPSTPSLPRLFKSYDTFSKISDKATHHTLDCLEHESTQIETWTKEKLDHLHATANRTRTELAWSYLETITNSALSIFSLVAGSYLMAADNGGQAGGLLIAAGVSNILQALFKHHEMCDWVSDPTTEKNQASRDQLKRILPLTLFFCNLALSIQGLKAYAALTAHQDLVDNLNKALTYAAGARKLNSAYTSFQKGTADARLIVIQAALKMHEQKADLLSRFVEVEMQKIRQTKSTIKKSMNTVMQAATLATQKV